MFVFDRRSRKNVQIFGVLSIVLLMTGAYLYFISLNGSGIEMSQPETGNGVVDVARLMGEADEEGKSMNDDLNSAQKAFYVEKINEGVAVDNENFEQRMGTFDNMEGAQMLRGGRITELSEINQPAMRQSDSMTADAFYDEKLKQKQTEDMIAQKDNADLIDEAEPKPSNRTIQNINVVGKSEAVQNWLEKRKSMSKPLTEYESNIKIKPIRRSSKLSARA